MDNLEREVAKLKEALNETSTSFYFWDKEYEAVCKAAREVAEGKSRTDTNLKSAFKKLESAAHGKGLKQNLLKNVKYKECKGNLETTRSVQELMKNAPVKAQKQVIGQNIPLSRGVANKIEKSKTKDKASQESPIPPSSSPSRPSPLLRSISILHKAWVEAFPSCRADANVQANTVEDAIDLMQGFVEDINNRRSEDKKLISSMRLLWVASQNLKGISPEERKNVDIMDMSGLLPLVDGTTKEITDLASEIREQGRKLQQMNSEAIALQESLGSTNSNNENEGQKNKRKDKTKMQQTQQPDILNIMSLAKLEIAELRRKQGDQDERTRRMSESANKLQSLLDASNANVSAAGSKGNKQKQASSTPQSVDVAKIIGEAEEKITFLERELSTCRAELDTITKAAEELSNEALGSQTTQTAGKQNDKKKGNIQNRVMKPANAVEEIKKVQDEIKRLRDAVKPVSTKQDTNDYQSFSKRDMEELQKELQEVTKRLALDVKTSQNLISDATGVLRATMKSAIYGQKAKVCLDCVCKFIEEVYENVDQNKSKAGEKLGDKDLDETLGSAKTKLLGMSRETREYKEKTAKSLQQLLDLFKTPDDDIFLRRFSDDQSLPNGVEVMSIAKQIKDLKDEVRSPSEALTEKEKGQGQMNQKSPRPLPPTPQPKESEEIGKLRGKIKKLEQDVLKVTTERNDYESRLKEEKNRQADGHPKNVKSGGRQPKENAELQRISSELQRYKYDYESLKKEKETLLNRLSQLAGAKLTGDNANIADLSDPNRPTKIAEMYNELYDNEWTDAYGALSQKIPERDTLLQLQRILIDCYYFCQKQAETQWKTLLGALYCDEIRDNEKADNQLQMNESDVKQMKDIRRATADFSFKNVVKNFAIDRKGKYKVEFEIAGPFMRKCIHICWLMSLQSPRVELYTPDMENPHGQPFDESLYRFFTQSGDKMDFIVWPPLLLHEGGALLQKGVAQPISKK